jgi:hypothetical protein
VRLPPHPQAPPLYSHAFAGRLGPGAAVPTGVSDMPHRLNLGLSGTACCRDLTGWQPNRRRQEGRDLLALVLAQKPHSPEAYHAHSEAKLLLSVVRCRAPAPWHYSCCASGGGRKLKDASTSAPTNSPPICSDHARPKPQCSASTTRTSFGSTGLGRDGRRRRGRWTLPWNGLLRVAATVCSEVFWAVPALGESG